MPFSAQEKLAELRTFMQELHLDLFVVQTSDAHNSEYPPPPDARRAYISNFDGSAGAAFIAKDKAWLATDGRYFLQAENQLDSQCWELIRQGVPRTFQVKDIFSIQSIKRVGFDPFVTSSGWVKQMLEAHEDKGIELVPVWAVSEGQGVVKGQRNLVDLVWSKDGRPDYCDEGLEFQSLEYSGVKTSTKLAAIRDAMAVEKVSLLIVSNLDEIAWLTNLRGTDTHCNRVFVAYVIITGSGAALYLKGQSQERLEQRKSYLADEGIKLLPYESFMGDLHLAGQHSVPQGSKAWVDPAINFAVFSVLADSKKEGGVGFVLADLPFLKQKPTPLQLAKAVKNPAEILGMTECHVADGAAVVMYLAWLDSLSHADLADTDEVSAADKLAKCRDFFGGEFRHCPAAKMLGASFDTISGMGSNGAIIHYRASKESAKTLFRGMYLVDSGAHYNGGTTDITRTVHLGEPSDYEKDCYTRVLKGHVALGMAIFPEGTRGHQLDSLARAALWAKGLDFAHGTGHGVGASICVHEFPPSISGRPSPSVDQDSLILKPGMFVSNEPGYYEDGKFGIRIENVMMVKKVITEHNFQGMDFLGFETVTRVPYCRKLIKVQLLSDEEISSVNDYHAEVARQIRPILEELRGDRNSELIEISLNWLDEATSPL